MHRPPPLESLRAVVGDAVPNLNVESIRAVPSSRLQRAFSVQAADGRTLSLILAPPSSLRLLRSEKLLVSSEALVIRWILNIILEYHTEAVRSSNNKGNGSRHQKEGPSRKGEQGIQNGVPYLPKEDVLPYVPSLITCSSNSGELDSAFNLLEPTRGTTIASLSPPLTARERQLVDFQTGQLARHLSRLTSSNGEFGPAAPVLQAIPKPAEIRGTRHYPYAPEGSKSWKRSFHSLLEGILRDGEDMAVTISYETIRSHFHRLSHLLDAVTTPRLVVVDLRDDDNVLISRSKKVVENEVEEHAALTSTLNPQHEQTQPSSKQHEGAQEAEHAVPPNTPSPTIAVTGLFDWSNSIFGDPLFAMAFAQNPTPDFTRGFCRDTTTATTTPNEGEDLIEDRENAPTRLLLYECYHATVCIVKQFYRPNADSSRQEIAARRRLAAVLAKLDAVDEAAGKRPRRASGDVFWPVKKARSNTPEIDMTKDS